MRKPYDRMRVRGRILNRRTWRMLRWAERKAGFKFGITQGSYNRGVAASAGTHDGGGCVDLSVAGLTAKQRIRMVRALKDAGFAAWYRRNRPGVWGPHVHAVAIGDKQLAPLARQQVQAFTKRRDGLAGNGPDNTYRPRGGRKWSWVRNRPVRRWI